MHRISCFLLSLWLGATALRAETEPHYMLGDMNADGKITQADIYWLASVSVGRAAYQQGAISQGTIVISEVAAYTPLADQTTFLNGDMNHDGMITPVDLVWLVSVCNCRRSAQYAVIRDGKIVYAVADGFIFIPEDDDFIDDGEIEF